jgi:hypothetical protein
LSLSSSKRGRADGNVKGAEGLSALHYKKTHNNFLHNFFDVLGVLERQKRFRRVVFDVSETLKNSLSEKLSF